MQRVREAIRLRHYSSRTEESYVGWIRRYIRFHGLRHPRELDAGDVTRFLTSLADAERLSASSQTQALSALLFLYKDVLRRELRPVESIVGGTVALRQHGGCGLLEGRAPSAVCHEEPPAGGWVGAADYFMADRRPAREGGRASSGVVRPR
jgi:hypothetical protein